MNGLAKRATEDQSGTVSTSNTQSDKRWMTLQELSNLVALARRKISDVDLGWVAGIIDGEGTITIAPRKRTDRKCRVDGWMVTVRVANTDSRIIQKLNHVLHDLLGCTGYVQEKRPNRCAKCYYWLVANRRALVLLELVYPYLVSKKEQAEVAIEFQRRMSTFSGIHVVERDGRGRIIRGNSMADAEIEHRMMLYEKIKQLNARGKEREKYYEQVKAENR
ncbi:MAG: LAGLIDADG family homing endonuclease [Desulfotomaculales bacterium]